MFSCKYLLNKECQISNKECNKDCIIYNHCPDCKHGNDSFLSDNCAGCEAVRRKMSNKVKT